MVWNKLWAKILASSVWEEPLHVRAVWIALIASAGADGIARVNPTAVYRLANVTKEQAEDALERLQAPDPNSTTPDEEGRRIRMVPGEGIFLINHGKHHVRTPGAERQARYRERQSQARGRDSDGARHSGVTTRPDQTRPDETKQRGRGTRAGARPPSPPQDAQGTPVVWYTLEGWEPSEELLAEAAMQGISKEVFRDRLKALRNGPVGGQRGTLDRDEYVRIQFPKWRTWSEEQRALKTQGRSTALAPPLEPTAKHREYAAKHGLDLAAAVQRVTESPTYHERSRQDALDVLGRLLVKTAKERKGTR